VIEFYLVYKVSFRIFLYSSYLTSEFEVWHCWVQLFS